MVGWVMKEIKMREMKKMETEVGLGVCESKSERK